MKTNLMPSKPCQKVAVITIICATLFILSPGSSSLLSSLLDFYRKGPMVMVPDPDYVNFDYESLFYDSIKRITVTHDGTIFVSNGKQHNISKFQAGRLIKVFSQAGEGPPDLYYPGNLGILDDSYLVINQYSQIGKISIFDLEGNFVNVIKTNHNVVDIAPLMNKKIAILISTGIDDRKYSKNCYKILIKDIVSGAEKYAWSHTITSKSKLNGIRLKAAFYSNKIFLLKIGNGNFLVSYSGSPDILIYSIEGEKIRHFKVNWRQKRITNEMKEEFRQVMLEHSKRNNFIKDDLKRVDWGEVFPEYTPYYSNIAVDSENNILVFEHNGFEKVKKRKFQVYDPEGRYQFESEIDFGLFKSKSDFQLIFANGNIYSLLNRKDTEDILLSFIKIRLK